MNCLWLNKYKPVETSDFINLEKEIKKIKDWLLCFKNNTQPKNFKNGLLISGGSGVGKSSLVRAILKEVEFSILEFDASSADSANIIESKIKNTLSNKNILSFMSNIKKTCIVIDELDVIDSKREFGSSNILEFLSYDKTKFYKKVKTKKSKQKFIMNKCPIICISNGKYSKKIKKECLHITISAPSDSNIHILITKILKNEKLFLDNVSIQLIISITQNDYRRSIILLEDIASFVSNNVYDKKKIIDKIYSCGNKDVDETIYTCTNNTFTENKTIDQLGNIYNKYNKSFMFLTHANSINVIDTCCLGNYKKKLEISIKYYKDFLLSNMFLKKSFNHWYLQKYNIIGPKSLNLLLLKNKKMYNPVPYLEHSLIISKYNYRFYNLKAINRLSKKLDMDIKNFSIFSYMLYNILFHKTDKDITTYIKILKNLNFDKTDFLKVVKLSALPTNISITKKTENVIKKIFSKV